ncbi:PI-PLC X domain-containing protein 1 isoform X4 [Equus asinus]|uniref:PI-PLC X domain-containing protein 1 isoform X4 n=1 Tax=Equus asinus TaxID=9793 RepID=UPI0038F78B88
MQRPCFHTGPGSGFGGHHPPPVCTVPVCGSEHRGEEGLVGDCPLGVTAGSHDTMTYCLNKRSPISHSQSWLLQLLGKLLPCVTRPMVLKWSVTQALDVTKQLDAGVRYLDLRVAHVPEGSRRNLHFVHFVYTTALVEDTLTEISEWLERHPREVVILACRDFEGLTEELHEYLVACVRNIFGDMLCPRGVPISPSGGADAASAVGAGPAGPPVVRGRAHAEPAPRAVAGAPLLVGRPGKAHGAGALPGAHEELRPPRRAVRGGHQPDREPGVRPCAPSRVPQEDDAPAPGLPDRLGPRAEPRAGCALHQRHRGRLCGCGQLHQRRHPAQREAAPVLTVSFPQLVKRVPPRFALCLPFYGRLGCTWGGERSLGSRGQSLNLLLTQGVPTGGAWPHCPSACIWGGFHEHADDWS